MSRDISIIYFMKKNTYNVTPETKGDRLDIFISSKKRLTRSYIHKLIKQGFITVNSRKVKAGYKVREGDLIEVTVPDEPEGILVPEDIPVEILWEDEYIIVVNKPPHMVIYPAFGNKSGTLMNALISRCNRLSSIGAPLRPGVVHRLDKDTSGVLVVAKNDTAYFSLVNQFRHRETEKHYMALLFGNLKTDCGEIRAAIGRSVSDRKKMSIKTNRGKEAITRFEVIKRFKYATLVKVRIITGRTHQIRVHFASIGNPVLGDSTYGKKTALELGQKTINFDRQMLHACSLKFVHPATGKKMKFTAPMPEDMEMAIEDINKYSLNP
jgi:23S rRNA pseudouridine1911/1915/1917 synthase